MWGGRFGDAPDAIMAEINASIDVDRHLYRQDIAGSSMGNCLKVRARRMVFPAFSGDDVEVEIPLVLTKTSM